MKKNTFFRIKHDMPFLSSEIDSIDSDFLKSLIKNSNNDALRIICENDSWIAMDGEILDFAINANNPIAVKILVESDMIDKISWRYHIQEAIYLKHYAIANYLLDNENSVKEMGTVAHNVYRKRCI